LTDIWQGFVKAIELIVSLNPEVFEIAGRSLLISLTSTVLGCLIFIPLGSVIRFYRFPGKRLLINIIQTFFSIPSVSVGLFVFVLFSKAGPLGGLGIMFTPIVMVVGQIILIAPILLALTIAALSGVNKTISDTALSLGASNFQTMIVILKEARYAVVVAIIIGFGRAISELGLALMVGGNIKGFTRVLTTAISLETSMGNLELALALGMILLAIALVINIILNRIQIQQR
jgi:tungstate transport system permease protein